MTKKGFTLIEMLLVMGIVMSLELLTVRVPALPKRPHDTITDEFGLLSEKARFLAMEKHREVTISFIDHGVFIDGQCVFWDEKLSVIGHESFTFNEKGHIQSAGHVNFRYQKQNYRWIYNVGNGAYRYEKNGIYFIGCPVWLAGVYAGGHRALYQFHRSLQKLRKSAAGRLDRGFTLSQALFALVICDLIITGYNMMLHGLKAMPNLTYHSDMAYALIALRSDVNTSKSIEVYDQSLILHQNEKDFTVSLDDSRLVKKPGFNIYVHNVEDVSFYHDGEYVYMEVSRDETSALYNIGAYYRPQSRVCEPFIPDASGEPDESGGQSA